MASQGRPFSTFQCCFIIQRSTNFRSSTPRDVIRQCGGSHCIQALQSEMNKQPHCQDDFAFCQVDLVQLILLCVNKFKSICSSFSGSKHKGLILPFRICQLEMSLDVTVVLICEVYKSLGSHSQVPCGEAPWSSTLQESPLCNPGTQTLVLQITNSCFPSQHECSYSFSHPTASFLCPCQKTQLCQVIVVILWVSNFSCTLGQ